MFTGLVEAIGRVIKVSTVGTIVNLQIEAPFSGELKKGQSVCVSGACLTVVNYSNTCFNVEMMIETVKRTKFSALLEKSEGITVNLERALRTGDRLDGHFVLGHIDGVGTVNNLHDGGAGSYIIKVGAAPEIIRQMVGKGSVALDGVSLTIIESFDDCFSVGLIPATLANCTLGKIKTGDKLNIETDIIGKYVFTKLSDTLSGGFSGLKNVNQTGVNRSNKNSISLEKLIEMGW
jgi:riboflavin synthase